MLWLRLCIVPQHMWVYVMFFYNHIERGGPYAPARSPRPWLSEIPELPSFRPGGGLPRVAGSAVSERGYLFAPSWPTGARPLNSETVLLAKRSGPLSNQETPRSGRQGSNVTEFRPFRNHCATALIKIDRETLESGHAERLETQRIRSIGYRHTNDYA